jgi:hypothetical protein
MSAGMPKPPVDAKVLASIRWFANLVEMMAIERYVGDRRQEGEIKRIFQTAVIGLKQLSSTGGCPDDWENCTDGKCEPTCLEWLLYLGQQPQLQPLQFQQLQELEKHLLQQLQHVQKELTK